jgi:hypothetical protein
MARTCLPAYLVQTNWLISRSAEASDLASQDLGTVADHGRLNSLAAVAAPEIYSGQ